MNNDFEAIKNILSEIRAEYISCFQRNETDYSEIGFNNPRTLITERDIVAEIYCRLKEFCNDKDLSVHTEIKPVDRTISVYDEDELKALKEELKKLPRIDIVILSGKKWIEPAIKLQNAYAKGKFEARFSSVPVDFFHTAIEVKIQSKSSDAIQDINKLKKLHSLNEKCNLYFVLLNARGQQLDHDNIRKEHSEKKGICVIDYTCNN